MSGLSQDELAKVLAAVRGEAPPPPAVEALPVVEALPAVVPTSVPVDVLSVEHAQGTVLADALGDPNAPRRPSGGSDDAPGREREYVPPRPSPYRCTVCGGEMDAFHSAIGTHPSCDPEPAPIADPPSTIADLAEVLVEYDHGSERSMQKEIGPSELAVPCERQLAYRLHGKSENPDGRVKWPALQGTAMHALVAEALRKDNARIGRERWLIEREVWPDPHIKGHADLYDTDTNTVIDWKLVGKSRLDVYRRKGPGDRYEGQAQLYGLGYQRAGFPVRFIRVVFLPRTHDFSEAYEWTAAYSRKAAEAWLDRMYRLMDTLHTEVNPSSDPHVWESIPATPSDDCRFCPYFRRGRAADGTGCPGDVEAQARRDARFDDGLIPS